MSTTPPDSDITNFNFVIPNNTSLPETFYSKFNITPLHVQSNNTLEDDEMPSNSNPIHPHGDTTTASTNNSSDSQLSKISLFDDLHEDHSLATNIDLMYEVLYQAHRHVPAWKSIPFEVFCNIVEIKPLLGGFTNLLVSLELREEFLTDSELQATRFMTLQKIIKKMLKKINNDDTITVPVLENPTLLRPFSPPSAPQSPRPQSPSLSPTLTPVCPNTIGVISPTIQTDEDGLRPTFFSVSSLCLEPDHILSLDIENEQYIYIKPAITKVAIRIYGTSEFTNRSCELALAKAASDKQISEFVYASWRHGRITSFLDGSSLGPVKWYDPILSSTCGYIQGQLHATNFLSCFKGTSLPIPNVDQPQLIEMLKNWCRKSFSTKFSQAVRAKKSQPPSITSIFDMFTSTQNQLYVVNRPASALKSKALRCENLILPLPPQLESIILPLIASYQIDTPESDPVSSSHFPYPHRSQRSIELGQFKCVQDGVLKLELDNGHQPKQTNPGEIAQVSVATRSDGTTTPINNYTIPLPTSRLLSREESELVVEYLDLPRMRAEIQWLIQQCALFPVVTSHNDYHSGNVLLLDSVLQTQFNEPTTHSNDGHVISTAPQSTNPLNPTTTDDSNPYIRSASYPFPVSLPMHPFPFPNQVSDWIKVIDFEYGGLNYRGYDTANSSNETWIVYDGSHPGFTLDIPAWVSTAFMGKYDPSVMTKSEQSPPRESDEDFSTTYQCFDHCHIPSIYDQQHLNKIIQVWNQPEAPIIGETIQHILLGVNATTQITAEAIQSSLDIATPSFRPREVMWAEACLTGFYHATKQHHYRTCPDPDNTPIYPFQTTSPSPQAGFDSNYTLPATLDEWLKDQVPKLLYETMILQLASMLAWSFWGITFTEGFMCEGFGYLEHALARMIAYVAKKELLVKMGLLQSPWEKE